MKIEYKISEYCDQNHLFNTDERKGIRVSTQDNAFLIEGSPRDLVELADLLVNVSLSKSENEHIHLDTNTLIREDSEIPEMIIERK